MRKLMILALGLLVVSCQSNSSKSGSFLTASVKNVEDGTQVFISRLANGSITVPVDTAIVKDEKISVDLPEVDFQTLNILKIEGAKGNMLFINENTALEAKIYKDSLRKSEVTGGPSNKLFAAYTDHLEKTNHEFIKLRESYTQDELTQPDVREKLDVKRRELQKSNTDFRTNAIKENANSLATIFIFSDLMRSRQVPQKEMKALYEGLSDQVKSTFMGQQIGDQLTQLKATAIGNSAPEFSAKTPEGEMLALKDAMGEYTLIDFWASWCKPCRVENPNVVRVYKKYHEKGLNIIGVSLDKSHESWVNAIEADGLLWAQVSNLKFWRDPIAKKYNVKAIPTNFLLDADGNIVAKNLRGVALQQKMEELLGE